MEEQVNTFDTLLRMDEPQGTREARTAHRLFTRMLDLLIAYEVESVVLNKVVAIAEYEFTKIDDGRAPGFRKAVSELVSNPAIQKSAEEKFAQISQLRRSLSIDNLDLALQAIEYVIARKTKPPIQVKSDKETM